MTTDHVFPEDEGTGANDGDYADAANFASAMDTLTDYVANGMSFTVDYGVPSVDVSAGKAFVSDSAAGMAQSAETRDRGVSFAVEAAARSGLGLTDGDVNHVYLDVDLTQDDGVSYTINTTGSAPADPALKIGEIDTTNDTKDEGFNRSAIGLDSLGSILDASNNVETEHLSQFDGTVSRVVEDTSGNLSAGTADRLAIESDTGRVLFDNGSSFVEVGLSESQISLANLSSRSHADLSDAPADAHHTDPTAGTGITDEGTNQFGISDNGVGQTQLDGEEIATNNTTHNTPIAVLEPGESYELAVPVQDGKTVELHAAGAFVVDEASFGGFTTDVNLLAEIVDESGTVQYSGSGANYSAAGSTLYNEENLSGGLQLWKVRVNNTDGSTAFDSPGAIGAFSVVVK